MVIKFGPAGLGSVKNVEARLEEYSKLGFKAATFAFTYGAYLKKKEDAVRIGKSAKKFGIDLSIHAPYWINLNSKEKAKIEASKKRVLKSLEIGTWLKAKEVIIHAGFYSGMEKEIAYENIKKQILELQKIRKEKKYTPQICVETIGKINVFGSAEEVAQLVKDTQCGFCLDFAHILAREKKVDIQKIKRLFPQKKWHCHFSGIVYGEKGEKHHRLTTKKEWKELLDSMPKNKSVTIINESPNPVADSSVGLEIYSTKLL
ncbi:TIM barrel protein [archaeon]|jgi:deoxyribonuclease IV|nr:TIM barrel protein [archaeon]MBT4373381.1 TIM barrel protein [archaeon]MBT4531829.1 TIM barrel protein [archaeon]MBT7001496.1 TIM barrel protein [archaeon]MBT7282612.1 TIM barrel protein [archaeon]